MLANSRNVRACTVRNTVVATADLLIRISVSWPGISMQNKKSEYRQKSNSVKWLRSIPKEISKLQDFCDGQEASIFGKRGQHFSENMLCPQYVLMYSKRPMWPEKKNGVPGVKWFKLVMTIWVRLELNVLTLELLMLYRIRIAFKILSWEIGLSSTTL